MRSVAYARVDKNGVPWDWKNIVAQNKLHEHTIGLLRGDVVLCDNVVGND